MDVVRMGGVFVSSAFLLAACAGMSGGGSRTALLNAADSETSALEFRAVANKLAIRVPGLVELTGDRMLARTFDPELRRRALLWKLDGTAASQKAPELPERASREGRSAIAPTVARPGSGQ